MTPDIAKAFHEDNAEAVRSFLKESPELKAKINDPVGPFGSPAICLVKSREMLDVLLEAGADINARSIWAPGSFGLLDQADPDLAAYAIARGAKVTVHAAARLGKIDLLQIMLDGDPALVHARGGDGQLPLHFASTIEIADLLLKRGADINARDIDHESTAAQWMIKSRQPIARHLVERGCQTDLLMAAALGDTNLAKSILDENPAAIRTRVSDEYFPMVGSAENGGTIYQWELGWYVSAHQVARNFRHQEMFDLLWERSPAEVRLVTACWLGDTAQVNELATQDLTLTEEDQCQIAHAARNNDLPAVKLMLQADLPVNATSQHRATTLHWACWHGNTEMVDLLLAAGADVQNQDNDYNATPLGWAIHASEHGWDPARGDYPKTIETLKSNGAK